jgi:adenosine kinase
MKVIISGSLAYDRIMNFPEYFSDHILPDKIHVLNVCFQVDGVKENLGGTAGNIAYALRLMGGTPSISATIGSDNHRYFEWFADNSISITGIRVIYTELTAGAYITTDKGDNQITGFNPGAMKYSSELDFTGLEPEDTLVLVSPGNLDDMIAYPRRCRDAGIPYIFDPGQSLPVLQADALLSAIRGAKILIVNDYEFDLILDKTELTKEQLLDLAESTIITLGEAGSMVHHQGQRIQIPAFPAKRVVDPTGAGDAYRGGLLSGLTRGMSLEESARLGSACASFAVEHYGTQVYRFTAEEFAARLDSGR